MEAMVVAGAQVRLLYDSGAQCAGLQVWAHREVGGDRARAAWWSLGRPTLEAIADSLGVDLAGASSVFDTAFKLTQAVLGLKDDQVFTIMEQRLVHMSRSAVNVDEVMQVDEAAQCLREEDRSEIQAEQKKVQAPTAR